MNEDKPSDDSNNEAETVGEHQDDAEIDSSSVNPNQGEETGQENNAAVQNAGHDSKPSQGSGNAVTNALWGTAEAAINFAQQNPRATIVGGIVIGSDSLIKFARFILFNRTFAFQQVLLQQSYSPQRTG